MTRTTKCQNCDGTGKIVCANSWIIVDGYRRERCGICAGTGVSGYRPDPAYVRWQRAAKARIAEWGAMSPPDHIARELAPALFR